MNQTYPYVDLWPGFKNLILSLEQYILNKDNKEINAGNSSEGLEGNAKNSLEGLEIGATDT
ncbi:2646_t:CDS:2, partial [Rhizophagus irregularis]